MASTTTILGAAGEHYVMFELLRRGYIAGLAPYGVPNADIIVTDVDGTRACSIQVKTRRELGTDGGWHMSAKHERIRGERLFYCFVDFRSQLTDQPSVYVMPSAVVADVLSLVHRTWLSAPGKNGRVRQDSAVRRLTPDYSHVFRDQENPYPRGWLEKYRSAWNTLQLETTEVEAEQETS